MKKFFTLFAAALVVLSASAITKASRMDATELAQVSRSEARAFHTERLVKATTTKAQAPTRVQDQTIVCDYAEAGSWNSYYGDGSWDITLYNGDNFAAMLFILTDGSHIVGSFDIADADEYGYPGVGLSFDGQNLTYATSGTFAISFVSSVNGVLTYHINASFVVEGVAYAINSDVEVFAYDAYYYKAYSSVKPITLKDAPHTPVVVTDTVAVTFYPYYNAEGKGGWVDNVAVQGWWQYQGETADHSLYVTLSNIETTQTAGTYTIDDMDLDYTYIVDEVAGAEYAFESITVVVAENNGVITLTAQGVCENGIYYIMTCEMEAPTGLNNVEAVKAQKTIENGQLVILKNGVRYNAQGAQL